MPFLVNVVFSRCLPKRFSRGEAGTDKQTIPSVLLKILIYPFFKILFRPEKFDRKDFKIDLTTNASRREAPDRLLIELPKSEKVKIETRLLFICCWGRSKSSDRKTSAPGKSSYKSRTLDLLSTFPSRLPSLLLSLVLPFLSQSLQLHSSLNTLYFKQCLFQQSLTGSWWVSIASFHRLKEDRLLTHRLSNPLHRHLPRLQLAHPAWWVS